MGCSSSSALAAASVDTATAAPNAASVDTAAIPASAAKVHRVDVSSVATPDLPFCAVSSLGANVYVVNAEQVLKVQPGSGAVSCIHKFDGSTPLTMGLCSLDTALYVACESEVLKLEPASTKKFHRVNTSSIAENRNFPFAGLCPLGGQVYAAPFRTSKLLEIDGSSERVRGVPVGGGPREVSGLCAFRGKLYAPPFDGDSLLEIEPASERVRRISVSPVADGGQKFCGICALGAKLYAAPFHADRLLEFDPNSGEMRGIGIPLHDQKPRFAAICALGSKLYLAPCKSNTILEVEPTLGLIHRIVLSSLDHRQGVESVPTICALGAKLYATIGTALFEVISNVVPFLHDDLADEVQNIAGPNATWSELALQPEAVQQCLERAGEVVTQLELEVGWQDRQAKENRGNAARIEAEIREVLTMKKKAEDLGKIQHEAKEGLRCVFWCLKAGKIRSSTSSTLPAFQSLRSRYPDWFTKRIVSLETAKNRSLVNELLVVSHRWEEPGNPDPSGVQLHEVRKHLRSHPSLQYVWYDYWCLPQGKEKTEDERREFKATLPNVNLLYLSGSVLLLVDMSYLSRFWTQLEAWLSMQAVADSGIASASAEELRCTVVCIHNAPEIFAETLKGMWLNKAAAEVAEILAKPDVTVTNEGDKSEQLEKLAKLSDLLKNAP